MKSYHDFIIVFLYLYIYGNFLGVLSCTIRNPPGQWAGIFPNPRQDVGSCGRNCTKSWVCDPTNILGTRQANELDSIIDTIAISGICPCSNCSGQEGYLVFVFLTPRIQKVQGLSNEESASLIVSNLNAQWGKETSCGNSVVILISKEDKEVYTGVGPAASRVLTEHLIKTVNSDVKPLLTDGDYFSALVKILQSYNSTFHSNTLDIPIQAKSSGSNSPRDSFMTLLPVFIIIFAIGVIAVCLCKLCGKKSSANTKTRNSRRKGRRPALNKHSVPSVAYSKSHWFPSFGHASSLFSGESGGGFFGGGCDNSGGGGGNCGGGSSDCGGGGGCD